MNCQPHWIRQVDIWLYNNHTCLLCDEAIESALPICSACKLELPWLDESCQRCALPLPMSGLISVIASSNRLPSSKCMQPGRTIFRSTA